MTTWAQDQERSETMRASMMSLFHSLPDPDRLPVEIIVVDNGGSYEDSQWLLQNTDEGKIASYIRNRKNMHFYFARNQALKICTGDFIVIADNDIAYASEWMEHCVDFLQSNAGKYLATPIAADPMNSHNKGRWAPDVGGWKVNYRAGSNCFMMRRSDFEVIGYFDEHRIAGSKYCDRFVRLGYAVAIMPRVRALDMGFRKGYNLNAELPNKEL